MDLQRFLCAAAAGSGHLVRLQAGEAPGVRMALKGSGNRHIGGGHLEGILVVYGVDVHLRLSVGLINDGLQIVAAGGGGDDEHTFTCGSQCLADGDGAVGRCSHIDREDLFHADVVRAGGGDEILLAALELVAGVIHTGGIRRPFFSIGDAVVFTAPLAVCTEDSEVPGTVPGGYVHIIAVACFLGHGIADGIAAMADHQLDTRISPVGLKIDSAAGVIGRIGSEWHKSQHQNKRKRKGRDSLQNILHTFSSLLLGGVPAAADRRGQLLVFHFIFYQKVFSNAIKISPGFVNKWENLSS